MLWYVPNRKVQLPIPVKDSQPTEDGTEYNNANYQKQEPTGLSPVCHLQAGRPKEGSAHRALGGIMIYSQKGKETQQNQHGQHDSLLPQEDGLQVKTSFPPEGQVYKWGRPGAVTFSLKQYKEIAHPEQRKISPNRGK